MPREAGFEITVASEVMAIFCLSESIAELRERLGRIIVAYTRDRQPVTAADLKAHGAMTVLLERRPEAEPGADAGGQPGLHPRRPLRQHRPRLQQRAGHQTGHAAFGIHGHRGRLRRRPGGGEVHEHQVPQGRHHPDAVVIVATVRALKHHGGVPFKELHKPNVEALDKGVENLKKHIENIHRFGLPVVVAINHFTADTEEEIQFIATSARTCR